MKQIDKRISALENRTARDDAGAWLAFIHLDGTVDLSHHKHGEIQLPTRQAFKTWYNETIVDDGTIQVFIVDIVNCQGLEPKEL